MRDRYTGVKLAIPFAILVAIVASIGWLGLNRMDRIDANLEEVLGQRWGKLQLAREALVYSNANSRITMGIFLLDDERLIDPLLAKRAENTQKISELVVQIKSQCDSPEERQLLAAIEATRSPYIASYLRALHLLVEEKQPKAARAVMVQETSPALYRYHDAWTKFMQFQMEQMDRAAKRSRAQYAATRAFSLLLIVLAAALAGTIGVLVTRKILQEMKARAGVEQEIRKLNATLEERVVQRTRELADANQRLASEVDERKRAEEISGRARQDWETDLRCRTRSHCHYRHGTPNCTGKQSHGGKAGDVAATVCRA